MSRVLAFDPSGNFSSREGKGVTGWALFENGKLKNFGRLSAESYNFVENYWDAHLAEIWYQMNNCNFEDCAVVCESYKLQPTKAMQQSWSALETPQLIGAMRMYSWKEINVPFVLQDPSIKARFSDEVLVKMGIAEKRGNKYYVLGHSTVDHERDAIRHGLYYLKYGKEKQK